MNHYSKQEALANATFRFEKAIVLLDKALANRGTFLNYTEKKQTSIYYANSLMFFFPKRTKKQAGWTVLELRAFIYDIGKRYQHIELRCAEIRIEGKYITMSIRYGNEKFFSKEYTKDEYKNDYMLGISNLPE